jgi:uncharacterized protein (DUF362 family)
MSQPKYVVSIRHDKPISEMIHSAFEDLGGLHHIIPSGKRILIKPNLVVAKKNDTGATTNPQIIEALIQEVLQTQPVEVALGESSEVGENTMRGFKITGMDAIARRYGVKVIDFKRDPHITKEVPGGREIRDITIPATLFEYDYLINVPVLKIHCQTTVTIGMKNLKGCIHDKEKHRFHRLNLNQCIVDLNTVIQPDLTVVDATTCSLQWELGGDPVRLDTILMGQNVLAVDMIAASLLGYSVKDVPHLEIASRSGLGPTSIEEIAISNPLDKQASEEILSTTQKKSPQYRLNELKVVEKGTCTSCKGALIAAMRRLYLEGYSPRCHLVMGQLAQEEKEKLEKIQKDSLPVIAIGKCGIKILGGDSNTNIKGCPAKAEEIYRGLKEFS